jgi:arylsulfatase A-like enzyme
MNQLLEAPHELQDAPESWSSAVDRCDSASVDSAKAQKPFARPRQLGVLETWMLAVWFALVTGLSESAWFALQRFCLGNFIFAGNHVFWMAPAVQVVTASIICLPLCVLAWRTRHCTEDLAVLVFAFLATFNIILMFPKLLFVAQFLLAAGIAVQCSKWTQRRPGQAMSWVKRSLWWLLAAVAIVAAVTILRPAISERSARRALPPSPQAAPNILLIVLDTVRADAIDLGASDEDTRTPNLQRLAREGFVFSRAHSTSPWTLPSHATMLTGRLPRELSTGWYAAMNDEYPTIAEWLRDRGYRTGAFVGNARYCGSETGLDRGFMHYDDYDVSFGNLLLATAWGRKIAHNSSFMSGCGFSSVVGRRNAATIHRNAIRWIQNDSTAPYFALINLFDAHDPYIAPPAFRSINAVTEDERVLLRHWWIVDKQGITDDQAQFQHQAYRDCVAYLDHEIGRLLAQLRQHGRLENTVVIVTSDHGEHFGDHELYGHGNSLYQPAIHVPLIIWRSTPDLPSGQTDAIVSLCDISATIADFAASNSSVPFPGGTLARFWAPSEATHQATHHETAVQSEIEIPARWPACGGRSPIFRGAMKSVIWQGFKYIRNGDDVEEVYHLAKDPQEIHNLADSISPDLLDDLRRALDN